MKRVGFTLIGIVIALRAAGESTVLELSRTVERQLAATESHDFTFSLEADQYSKVEITQDTIAVRATVFDPGGKQLFEVNNGGSGSSMTAELVAAVGGTYRLQLKASDPTAAAGRYQIVLSEIQTASPALRERVAGARVFAQGVAAWARHDRDSVLKAIALFEESLPHWRSAQDLIDEAVTLYSTGLAYSEIGEQKQALKYVTDALPVAKASHHTGTEAWSVDSIGVVHNGFGDRRKAIEYFNQALPMMRAAKNRPGEGYTLNDLGMAYARIGEKRQALVYFDQAQAIYRELQDRRQLATIAANIGVTYGDLGEYERSLENYQRALALQRQIGNRVGEAITLNNVGTAYSSLADYQKALDSFRAALDIHRSLDRSWDIAINLHNIAWVYANLGDRRRALDLYQESLGILRKVNDRPRIANSLSNIGVAFADLGDYRKALEFESEAVSIRRAVGDRDGEASSLTHLGQAYTKLGEFEAARHNLEQAVSILRGTGDRRRLTAALRNLGALQRATGDSPRAAGTLQEALEICRAIHDRRCEAEAVSDLAQVARDRGDLATAHQCAAEALTAWESLRLTVASPALRASFFAAAREVQELDIDVLLRLRGTTSTQDFGAAALLAAESGRARSLLELLGESGAEIRRGVDPALLNRERQLVQLISGKAEQQTRLLNVKHTDGEAAAAARELDDLTAELEQLQSRIRTTSPEYAALTRPTPLSLQDIQTRVLDSDTVLLEYSLGAQRSFLWVVTTSSMDTFELPSRTDIESEAKRVYDLLAARNQKPANESPEARIARVKRADEAYAAAGRKLSATLLGPAAARIRNKRVFIVSEGALQYLPFAALPEPTDGEAQKAIPLIVNHEVVTAPSASVVAVLRQQTSDRKPAGKVVAILADPVFSPGDPRVFEEKSAGATVVKASRSADQPAPEFLRLRFSRAEAEEIARLAGPEATLKALDFDASRETALNPELGQYRIVHFATHSVLNDEHPEFSGVVLSLVDQSGRPQNGFLRLLDIYNLRLGAHLVVLSACQTALGGAIKGEGLIGLTRGFLYAGAPRVVATLWEIDDRTTAEAMKRFYEGVLGHSERPAAALRAAQVAMWKSRGWEAPYYWAAFTLQGEWR